MSPTYWVSCGKGKLLSYFMPRSYYNEGKIDMKNEKGSIELIVLGLLAALIVVLAVPLLGTIGSGVNSQLNELNTSVNPA